MQLPAQSCEGRCETADGNLRSVLRNFLSGHGRRRVFCGVDKDLQHPKGEHNRHGKLLLPWHVQMPDGHERDDEHGEIGEAVDGGRAGHEDVRVDARRPWRRILPDALEADGEDERDAVEDVHPDDDPARIVYLVLLCRRRHEDAQEHQQHRGLGEGHGYPSCDLDGAEELATPAGVSNCALVLQIAETRQEMMKHPPPPPLQSSPR